MDIEETKQIARLTEEEIQFIEKFRNLSESEKQQLVDSIKPNDE